MEWQRKEGRLTGLVFPSPVTGGCYHAGMIQKLHLKPAGERIGIQGFGWHAFRHSYRGLLDEAGANAGMQKSLMRHANISTTMNVYGRAAMKAKQETNSKVVQNDLAEEGALRLVWGSVGLGFGRGFVSC